MPYACLIRIRSYPMDLLMIGSVDAGKLLKTLFPFAVIPVSRSGFYSISYHSIPIDIMSVMSSCYLR